MSDVVLRMYTVYRDPADLPGVPFAVREFLIVAGAEPRPGAIIGMAPSLEAVRMSIPPHADACLARSPGDDPAIVETWV